MNKRSETRLFARLLRDEWVRREDLKYRASLFAFGTWVTEGFVGNKSFRIVTHPPMDYLAFLKRNRKHGDALCPYNAALSLISKG